MRVLCFLSDLTSLYKLKGQEGSLKYYQGLEMVKSVCEELLKDVLPHEDYLVMTDLGKRTMD